MSGTDSSPFLSPVSGLTAAFTCQSLDTPRRRLSMDTNSSSGTPGDAPSRISLGLENATAESPALEAFPADTFDNAVDMDIAASRISEDHSQQARSLANRLEAGDAVIVEPLNFDVMDARVSSVPLLVIPSLRSSSGSSGDGLRTPGVLVSPAPSPVFLGDDDSRDSGYGGESQAPRSAPAVSDHGLFLEPRERRAYCGGRRNTESRDSIEETAEDQMFEALKTDGKMDITEVGLDEPIAALLQEKILYEGDKRAAITRKGSADHGTPLKRKIQSGRFTRYGSGLDQDTLVRDSVKRATDENDESIYDDVLGTEKHSSCKRRKSFVDPSFTSIRMPLKLINRCHSETEAFFALQKDTSYLIGDHSKTHALPIVDRPRVHDLKCITSDTLKRLLHGEYSHVVHDYTLVDCRYPYEFEAGHIRDAINVHEPEQLHARLLNGSEATNTSNVSKESIRQIYVFYCEFSRERGPKMTRYLRKCDRQLNEHQYPKLFYPEIYLLEGGYKNFFSACKEFCEPPAYRPMHDENHLEELRRFRSKSKSWCSGAGDATGGGGTTLKRRPGLNRGLFSSKGY